ncbi:MAG: hypothetical protein WKF82_11875 [Nocardioidaceae bacterium]
MTTASLRSGSATTVKADVVVIGVLAEGEGVQLAPGSEAVAEAWGLDWQRR